MGIGQDFAQAAADLKRVGGLSMSRERLRGVVEATGQQAGDLRDQGKLAPCWTAPQAKLDDGQSRVYVGIDGVMAPTVTQKEKDKRRQRHLARRRQRALAQVGNTKPLPRRRAGSDERFKEMKIGLFYDQPKECRHVFVSHKDGKAGGARALLAGIDALDKQVRARRKKDSVRRQRNYVAKRREMLDYPTALANGWDISSGPAEATCKTLTLRLKRPGMEWDRDHAADMMNLIGMRESGQWKPYWAQQAAAQAHKEWPHPMNAEG